MMVYGESFYGRHTADSNQLEFGNCLILIQTIFIQETRINFTRYKLKLKLRIRTKALS